MFFLFSIVMIWFYIGPFLTILGAITVFIYLIRAHRYGSRSVYLIYVLLLVNALEFLFFYIGDYLTLTQLNHPIDIKAYIDMYVMWSSAFVPWLAWLFLLPGVVEGRGEIRPVKQAAITGTAVVPMFFYVPGFYDFYRAAKGEMPWDAAGFAQAGMGFIMIFPILKIGGLLLGAAIGWMHLRYRGREKQGT